PVKPPAAPAKLVLPPSAQRFSAPRSAIPPLIRPPAPSRPSVAPRSYAPASKPAVPARPAVPAKPAAAAPPKTPEKAVAAPGLEDEKTALPKLKVSTQVVVRELAEKMGIRPTDFIKKLMGMGVFATINQRLDQDAAVLIAADYGYDLELVPMYGEDELKEEIEHEKTENLKPRSAIITIMGHVDHGKTTLLDALRESNVVESEAGQITQHIGAYMVHTARGPITVLDTPGHEAFTAMRAHGVKVTDIVVLVVSAVDGVMPQTLEAINHAKAGSVPMIVAINKIDLPTANTQQIKQQLANHGLNPEEWGGKTPMVEISAKKRLNLDKLLELVSIQAEMMELKANPDKPGQGIVIEARLDPKKGVVATVINMTGTTRIGDPFTVGAAHGKVRALVDDHGERLQELKPSMPAEVLGISGDVPQAGDVLKVTENEREARHVSDKRRMNRREEAMTHQKHVTLLSLKSQVDQELLRNLNVVLKTDVFGSLQAVKDSLEKLSTLEVAIQILHAGVGNITESDVLLAKASNAIIMGFHVEADSKVQEAAKTAEVEIRKYTVIYDLIEDVRAAMSGMLAPEIVEIVTGRAEIQQIFDLSSGRVAGSLVREGKMVRNQAVRLMRGGEAVGNGKISGLKRFKEDVKEVDKGIECGILLEGIKDFRAADIVEAITREERVRRLTNV
ncbi:MAG: translation initiation factor IF-2, partial [Elusimicrobia bacterium CG08_land_8_20_14_0_20_59_10]